MSLSLFARKAAVCWSLAASCTTLLTAQTAYQPLGEEHAVAGLVPGDQSNPDLAISAAGGFVVWQDNAIDGQGFGIGAVALDTRLQAAQAPFRVNSDAKGDQENPRVTLLKEGGAAFFWRGGVFGFQKVYARFLSTSNTWAGADVLVSSPGHSVKSTPAVATLPDGKVVVLWSTFNQRGSDSMQDVYGQLFKATGEKVGPSFSVNQFTTYNQRTPAVAALPNGGFIATWISEQQRSAEVVSTNDLIASRGTASVDIYARLYDSAGSPVGGEFILNTNSAICANPAILTMADGRFTVAWSQGNPASYTNSWDVYARSFSALGVGGETVLVNTRLKFEQFEPRLAALGTDFLAVWTSARQDGSGDGVYGQYLTPDLQPVGAEFRVNTTAILNQNQPVLASDNFGRFYCVWRTGHVNGKMSEEIAGQIYAQPGFAALALATNYSGPAFVEVPDDGGNGENPGLDPELPFLDFPITPSGEVVLADAFAQAKGSYRGLAYNADAIREQDSGVITATTTATGGYTVNLKIGSRTYAFSGKFDPAGKATYRKNRSAGLAPITVTLQLDMTGTDQITGRFSDGVVTADFLANRAAYNAATNPFQNAGTYTFVMAPPASETTVPAGNGFGKIVIDASGKVILTGRLGDGTVITQNSSVSKNDVWAMFATPYQSRGRVMSWVQVTSEALMGDVVWIKPANKSKAYSSGFNVRTAVEGSRYVRPVSGKRVVEFPQGIATVVLNGAGLATELSLPIFLDMSNGVADASGSGVKAVISLPNGTFKGSFINPATGKRVNFEGALLQSGNKGAGLFLNNNFSGQVSILSQLQ